MGTLFALVLTVGMTNGDYQDVILDIYESQQQCETAATDQRINGECFPVNRATSYVATAMTGMRRLRALPGQVS